MAETTKIEWADHTFNPWRGCQKIAPGCANCYAKTRADRFGEQFSKQRIRLSDAGWKQPLKWNREAANLAKDERDRVVCNAIMGATGDEYLKPEIVRPRVFCASLADVFEDWDGNIVDHRGRDLWECCNCEFVAPYDPLQTLKRQKLDEAYQCSCGPDFVPLGMNRLRRDLFRLIDATPNLDWLILTKRPQNVWRMWPVTSSEIMADNVRHMRHGNHRKNVWLLTSVSEQDTLSRNGELITDCADLAAVTGLSAEPLLGPLDLTSLVIDRNYGTAKYNVLTGQTRDWHDKPLSGQGKVDWIIAGGESGHGARPFDVAWLDLIIHHCRTFETALFVKQLGANVYDNSPISRCRWPGGTRFRQTDAGCRVLLNDPKGGDPDEWPDDFRIRQFPTPRTA